MWFEAMLGSMGHRPDKSYVLEKYLMSITALNTSQ